MHSNSWQPAPIPLDEPRRFEALQSYCILDTPREPVFANLTALASVLFKAPIVLVALIDQHRQFFKSVIGLPVTELPRDSSFCGYTILRQEDLIVLDAAKDERFQQNPLVVESPSIRFYAGTPLIGKDGMPLGSFCVIDREPREGFTETDHECLRRFAALTVEALEARLYSCKLSAAERAMSEANERYRLATQATTEGIWDWDCSTDVVFQSARLRSILGEPPIDTHVPLGEWLERIHPSDLAAAMANVQRLRGSGMPWFEIEYRIQLEDGTWRWMHNRGVAVRDNDGTLVRVVGALADITIRKFIDPLTGLHTRASLMNALEQRIRTLEEGSFSLLLIDLDGFKRVNASLGRSGGDVLLTECTARLIRLLSGEASTLIAHVAGDEFAVLLDNASDKVTAVTWAETIRDVLEDPFLVQGKGISLTVSIGIAICQSTCERAGHLMQWAELARHESKTQGAGRTTVFSGEMHEQAIRRMILASDLREALTQDALTLHYQPQTDIKTAKVVGFEALSRWIHPQFGRISPAEFIPIAEECDLILELGRWTLRTAIRQLGEWQSQNLVTPDVTVAVNLSSRQFADPDLVENILRKLKLVGLPAECLSIEVTESLLIDDQEEALRILKQLKKLGIGLDLDDFGTGYSSMSYLHQFPFNALKIDRSFVMQMTEEPGTETIVRSIISLGKTLGLKVIAEGIETQQQLQQLVELGCDCGQGYFISRPLPAEEIATFMADRKREY